jgi:hypothetical protein
VFVNGGEPDHQPRGGGDRPLDVTMPGDLTDRALGKAAAGAAP